MLKLIILDLFNTESIDRDRLIKEFNLNPSKKIIYWLPTHIINLNEEDE